MAVNFPASPTVDQIYEENGKSWKWTGTYWKNLPSQSSAVGGGTDQVFYLNDNAVHANYVVPTGKNALSVGPITIMGGASVTVPEGSRWVVI